MTGGTDGIGLEVARQLSALGAELAIVGRRKLETLSLPEGSHYIEADLSKPDSASIILQALEEIGFTVALDHLVLNASVGYVGALKEETDNALLSLLAVNLKGPLSLCQQLFPALQTLTGSVCFIGSTAAGRATPDYASYTASKTALRDLADNLEIEWQGRVRVQLVSPGPTRTAFHKKAGMNEPPMAGLFMKPEEVAKGIVMGLAKGQARKRYSMGALLYFAAKRTLFGSIK